MSISSLARQAAWLNHSQGKRDFAPLGPLVLFTDDDRLADPRPYLDQMPRGSSVILRSTAPIDPDFARAVLSVARAHNLRLFIAGDGRLAHTIGASGLHLPSAKLPMLPTLKRRYPRLLISAACHTHSQLRLADTHKADAAFLSPLFATRSHQGATPLSAMQARLLLKGCHIPVYGLGGINDKTAPRLRTMPFRGFGFIDAGL